MHLDILMIFAASAFAAGMAYIFLVL